MKKLLLNPHPLLPLLLFLLLPYILFPQNKIALALGDDLTSSLASAELSTYSGLHNILGQAIKDPVLSGRIVISVAPLPDGNYTWNLGSSFGNKTVKNGYFQLDTQDISSFVHTVENIKPAKLILTLGSIDREFILIYKPNEIHSWQDLQAIRQNLSGNYILKKDIAFPDMDGNGKGDYNFEPIGKSGKDLKKVFPFAGSLNGGTHTIQYLLIDRPDEKYVGLFGRFKKNVIVRDLMLTDVYVVGKKYTGALVGVHESETNIINVDFTGIVLERESFGGLSSDSISNNEIAIGAGLNLVQWVENMDFLSYKIFQDDFARSFNLTYFNKFRPNWFWGTRFNYSILTTDSDILNYPMPVRNIANETIIAMIGLKLKNSQFQPVSGFLGFGLGFFMQRETGSELVEPLNHSGIIFSQQLGIQINATRRIFLDVSTDFWLGLGSIDKMDTEYVKEDQIFSDYIFVKWDILSLCLGFRF